VVACAKHCCDGGYLASTHLALTGYGLDGLALGGIHRAQKSSVCVSYLIPAILFSASDLLLPFFQGRSSSYDGGLLISKVI